MPQAKVMSMKQDEFIRAAVELLACSDGKIKSLQTLIDALTEKYKNSKDKRLPCRDTMYKYMRIIIQEFEQENDVRGQNPFNVFVNYSNSVLSLYKLMDTTKFSYKTLSENMNGFFIGLLFIESGKESKVSDILTKDFSKHVASVFEGKGSIMIVFKSGNREAEFYNLITPYNSEF